MNHPGRRGDPRGRPGPHTTRRGDPRGRPDPPMGYNTERTGDSAAYTTKHIACPYCQSTDTELYSLFGQQLLTAQYYCNACHTPFERIKDDDVLNDYAARKEDQP